jgi:hypothetical protein
MRNRISIGGERAAERTLKLQHGRELVQRMLLTRTRMRMRWKLLEEQARELTTEQGQELRQEQETLRRQGVELSLDLELTQRRVQELELELAQGWELDPKMKLQRGRERLQGLLLTRTQIRMRWKLLVEQGQEQEQETLRRQGVELRRELELTQRRVQELELELVLAQRLDLEQSHKSLATQKNIIITLLSRFLCERARAEWIGDLYEMRSSWRKQKLSSWIIHIRTVGVALQLLVAQLRCMAYDRVFTRFWERSHH